MTSFIIRAQVIVEVGILSVLAVIFVFALILVCHPWEPFEHQNKTYLYPLTAQYYLANQTPDTADS